MQLHWPNWWPQNTAFTFTRPWLLLLLLAIPLLRDQQVLGGLTVMRRTPGAFPTDAMALLETFAGQSALAIQNARLYECAKIYGTELEKRTSDLRQAQNALEHFQSRRPS